ncbi:SagB/ThcOx family dehydrogenase [Microtetraspora malaysiensis]|uniref:SagB family peptide dehydrogenase n=1 Tax=Microtetraspora malaysiensis TaxID=161358 RepID=A0ABW6SIZ6_9ACTN
MGLIGFREDAELRSRDGALVVVHPFGAVTVRGLPPRVESLLRGLHGRRAAGAGEEDLEDQLVEDGGTSEEIALLYLVLDRLGDVLTHAVPPLLRVVPIARDAVFRPPPIAPDDTVRLSGFALVRRTESGLVIESPLSRHRVELSPDALPLVASLGRAVMVKEAAADPTAEEALGHLVGAGVAELAGADGFAEDVEPVLRMWDFHDLLFHSRSRLGRHDLEFGATFRFEGELPAEPAIKPLPDGQVIELHRPSLEEAAAADPPFTAVLESRRSVRAYAADPPSAGQIGELLYRAARVRATYGPAPGMPYEASDRPYPGGGAAYELELYLTVNRCAGLERGIYYYDPLDHRLIAIRHRADDAETMLARANQATGGLVTPDVLITVTSRFQRVSWKYAGMAYATTLKNVGALYQTFYLVATAMGLAPCGLGSGDAELAARAFGLDWIRESSVGEFMIGSSSGGRSGFARRPALTGWRDRNDPFAVSET